jgi:hypothetical protein
MRLALFTILRELNDGSVRLGMQAPSLPRSRSEALARAARTAENITAGGFQCAHICAGDVRSLALRRFPAGLTCEAQCRRLPAASKIIDPATLSHEEPDLPDSTWSQASLGLDAAVSCLQDTCFSGSGMEDEGPIEREQDHEWEQNQEPEQAQEVASEGEPGGEPNGQDSPTLGAQRRTLLRMALTLETLDASLAIASSAGL